MQEQSNPMNQESGIMTVHDVAGYLRISEAQVYRLAKDGRVPAVRIGGSWRFRRDLIDAWIRQMTESSLHVPEKSGM